MMQWIADDAFFVFYIIHRYFNMKLNKQEIAVIRLLMANDDYVSSYEISASSGISRRMVREIVPSLRDRLAQEGIELESRTNKGYRFNGLTLKTRNRLLEMIEEGEKTVSQIPDDMLNRQIYINRRLIEADDYILVDDLADELLLSRTAISSLLKDIRVILKKYRLTIEQRPYHGIRVNGNEIDKRHALTDFNFTAFSDTAMFYDFMDTLAADETAWERDVLDVFRRYDIIFTDIALCDLLIGIAVQIARIVSGNELTEYVLQDVKENSEEVAAAREIAFSIKSRNFCELNENEIRALAAAIACKRSAVHMSFDDHDADEVSERIFDEIMKSTFVDYRASAKKGLIVQSVRHVMRQLRCDEKIRTEMWNTAFTRYPLAYSHARSAAEILTAETGKTCGKSHIVYLT
ncbi:MAG: HTH domain-containing protein [Erysipelotrichaceae bacterium]|nr:HTH domain-containing protein [Erysipelotrichaceae bacterium]